MASRQQRNLTIKALARDFVRENVPVPEFFEKIADAMDAERSRLAEIAHLPEADACHELETDAALLRKLAKQHQKEFS